MVYQLHPGMLSLLIGGIGLIVLLYFSLLEHFVGQTIGMRVVGIRTGTKTFYQAVIRNLFVVPLFPFNVLWIIEYGHTV